MEREVLLRRANGVPRVTFPPDSPERKAAEALAMVGRLSYSTRPDITPRGRLALQCDVAVRAVLA